MKPIEALVMRASLTALRAFTKEELETPIALDRLTNDGKVMTHTQPLWFALADGVVAAQKEPDIPQMMYLIDMAAELRRLLDTGNSICVTLGPDRQFHYTIRLAKG